MSSCRVTEIVSSTGSTVKEGLYVGQADGKSWGKYICKDFEAAYEAAPLGGNSTFAIIVNERGKSVSLHYWTWMGFCR